MEFLRPKLYGLGLGLEGPGLGIGLEGPGLGLEGPGLVNIPDSYNLRLRL